MGVDGVSSGNTTGSTGVSSDDSGGYGNTNVSQVDGRDVASHTTNIKGLNSFSDIQNYINQNIVQFFKGQSPPDLGAIDRTITELIVSLGNDNSQLAAVAYHAADALGGINLTVENQDSAGQRKISLGSSAKSISDAFFTEIAKSSADVQGYANKYFTQSSSPTETSNDSEKTETSTSSSTTETSSDTTENTNDKDSEKKEKKEDSGPSFSEEMLALLPDDVSLEDLDEILIIDIKTGKEVDTDDYDLDDEEEAKEYEEIMKRAITIKTDGHGEGLADAENSKKIADALVSYITKPYESSVSEDGLEELLSNLSLEFLSDIFLDVQNTIMNSSNVADINKLKKFKDKSEDSGVVGLIGEVYDYNYLGGNNGDPLLFLLDSFQNDPSYKLQPISIDKISTVLAEHLDEYLAMDEDERDSKYLNFISSALSVLSTSNPDNMEKGNMEKLLQKISEKTTNGDSDQVKEILSDLAVDAGINSFKEVSIQTGQSLISNFGEFTYTDENGTTTTFSSDEALPDKILSDLAQLLAGTHSSLDSYEGDPDSEAITASQVADAVVILSDKQQKQIIDKIMIDDSFDAADLKHLAKYSGDTTTNLFKLATRIEISEHLEEIDLATDTVNKAKIFADMVATFADPTSLTEMQDLIDIIVDGKKDFIGLDAPQFKNFTAALQTKLTDLGIATPEVIIENVNESLSYNEIKFDGYYADQATNTQDIYIDKIETGKFTLEDATALLTNMTEAEKADPAFFTNMIDEFNLIEDTTERGHLFNSIRLIMQALEAKGDSIPVSVKTNFTQALLEKNDNIKIPDENADGKEDIYGSILEVLTRDTVLSNATLLKSLDFVAISQNSDYIDFIAEHDLDDKRLQKLIEQGLSGNAEALKAFQDKLTQAVNDDVDANPATDFETALENIEAFMAGNNNTIDDTNKEKAVSLVMQAMNYSVTNGSIEEAKIQQLLDVLHYDPTKVDNPLHQLLADASIEFALSDDVAINNPNTGKQDFNNPDQKIVDMMYLFTKIRKADGGHDDVTRDLVQTLGATINTKGMQDKFSRDYLGESIHTNHEYASDSGDYHKDNYRVETRQAWERGYDNGEMPSP